MFGVSAFFGFVFFLFVSKEEISGHRAMQLASPRFIRTKWEGWQNCHRLYGMHIEGLSFLVSWVYIRNKAAGCNAKVLVRDMYATESDSAFFCKDWCGLCDPEDLWWDCIGRWIEQIFTMLKGSAAAERPGRLPLPVGAFHQAGWAAKGSCGCGKLRCPSRASMQGFLEATLAGSQSQAQPFLSEVPSCNPAARHSRPHRGAVPPAPPHRGGVRACV